MRNRGPQPNDPALFAPKHHQALTAATDDLCWLLSREYGIDSALQLVGNRYRLNKRQRMAVGRVSAAENAVLARESRRLPLNEIDGRAVAIDGFNLLILLESAFGGGLVLHARDGTYRDLAGVGKARSPTPPAANQTASASYQSLGFSPAWQGICP